MKTKVFICHSSKDKSFVAQLVKDLNSNNVDTFFDKNNMLLGDDLEMVITRVIKENCTHFIYVLSKHSLNSEWVKLEVDTARNQLKKNAMLSRIIMIKKDDCEMPPEFNMYLYENISELFDVIVLGEYDFPEDEDKKKYKDLIVKILRAIKSDRYKLNELNLNNIDIKNGDEYEFNNTFTLNIGYYDKKSYVEILEDKLKTKFPDILEPIYPIRFTSLLHKYFDGLKIGDELKLTHGSINCICHFAGYDKSFDGITMQGKVRRILGLEVDWENEPKRIYNVLLKADFESKELIIKSLNHTYQQ